MNRLRQFGLIVLICGFGSLVNFSPAAEPPPPPQSPKPVPLSAEDQKRYTGAAQLINESDGMGDQLERAYAILVDLAQRNPQSGYPYAGIADIKYALATGGDGSFNEAYTLVRRAIELDPNIPDAYVVLAKIMIKKNDLFVAQNAADKAINLAPDKPEAMFVKGSVAAQLGQYDDAERWYRKTIERHTDNKRKSNIYFWLGEMLKDKKPRDLPGAMQAYEKSAELAEGRAGMLYRVAMFFVTETDRYDKAVEYANRTLAIRDWPDARRALGLAMFYRWGDAKQNPGKYKDAKQKPEEPKNITAKTGVSAEYAFVENAAGSSTPWATIAMLNAGMIKDVNVVPPRLEYSALNAAAFRNHLNVVKILVAKGANVNAVDKLNKSTAIFYAVENGNLEMVKFLVENKARINVTTGDGEPLVVVALYRSKPDDVAILRYLLERGADPTIPDARGDALIVDAAKECKPAAVRLLIKEYRADPNTRRGNVSTLLSAAAVQAGTDCKEIVKFLIEAGANPWAKFGREDVLFMLNAPTVNPQMFPSFKENSAMILQARKSIPMPADFGAAYSEP